MQILGTLFLAIAVFHSFFIKSFLHLAQRFPKNSGKRNLCLLLGEVEIVFGLWAGIYLLAVASRAGTQEAIDLIERSNFTEPAFVFAIMVIASTRPILDLSTAVVKLCAKGLPFSTEMSFYFSALVVGPLLGSLITEPAAMTVTALLLRDRFFSKGLTERFLYTTLGVLFVNVSIGGVLTPFAAPPVIMVARAWNWDFPFMSSHFGWKAILVAVLNTLFVTRLNFRELKELRSNPGRKSLASTPFWLQFTHLVFLAGVVLAAPYPKIFIGILVFFLGLNQITQKHQEELRLNQSLLVAFFLAGLVVLGHAQGWWIGPLVARLDPRDLFIGSTLLTAVTDNAALTYLGSLIPHLSDSHKYALVAGAVAGGGLTVIANAPNPIGFAILNSCFGSEGVSPLKLLRGALIPTLIAMACFWLLPP